MGVVLFDGYGTLFDEGREAIPRIAERIGTDHGIPPQSVERVWSQEYFAIERTFDERFDTILGANHKSLKILCAHFGIPVPEADRYHDLLVGMWSRPPLYGDSLEAIRRLGIEHRLGLVSNSEHDVLSSAVAWTGLPISYVLSSERAMCYKPDPRIFHKACEDMGVLSEEGVYVGNSIVDIVGAKRAGMRMIHLNRHGLTDGTHAPDAIALSMADVERILQEWGV